MSVKTNRQPTEEEFMKNTALWPGSVCPIKRRVDGRLQCAYLVNARPVVYHGNMWEPKTSDPREEFESHAAIVAAGWVVD